MSLIFLTTLISCRIEDESTFSKLQGKWINKNNDYVEIQDTTSRINYVGNNVGMLGKYLQIINDTLSFQDRYTSSEDGFTKQRNRRTDFKLISVSDSFLRLSPISVSANKIFKTDTLKLIRQDFSVNRDINFDKIIFHTTHCFGHCPIYHLEVIKNGETKLHKEIVYKKKENRIFHVDTMQIGYYTGKISKELLNQLIFSIQTCNLENLNFRGSLCCDGSIKTIIIYYNGNRKYLKDMFPPKIAQNLIDQLYLICEKANLSKTNISFKLEN